jgi:predicted N-acyltransferase
MQVPYSYRLFGSFDEVDTGAWERARTECGASIVMDPRFLGAVESSMKQSCRFWYMLVYEDNSRPVACAVLTGTTIDLADFVDPGMAWVLRILPLRHLQMLICGLPVSTGHNTLGLAARNSSRQILPVIDGAICELASKMRMHGVVYREFRPSELEWTSPLLELGYRRITAPPTHFFKPVFQNLQHYCAALKSHYRKQIKRSIRKLELAGMEIKILSEPEQILKAYTPEVHNLYHQVRDRADVKFEVITTDYLRELASRMGSQVNLIVLEMGSRIIAFGWCLHTASAYYMFYAGLDYALNDELDLYFNLHYAALDCALRKRVSTIELGPSADAFKARLGCYSEPTYLFAKGLTRLMSLVVRYGANVLVPKTRAAPSFDVFNSDFVAKLN